MNLILQKDTPLLKNIHPVFEQISPKEIETFLFLQKKIEALIPSNKLTSLFIKISRPLFQEKEINFEQFLWQGLDGVVSSFDHSFPPNSNPKYENALLYFFEFYMLRLSTHCAIEKLPTPSAYSILSEKKLNVSLSYYSPKRMAQPWHFSSEEIPAFQLHYDSYSSQYLHLMTHALQKNLDAHLLQTNIVKLDEEQKKERLPQEIPPNKKNRL